MIVVVAVAVAAAAGTLARVAVVQGTAGRPSHGTLTVNIAGSVLLGVLVGAEIGGEAAAIVGTGALGALTTWSGVAVGADRSLTTVAAIGLPLLAATAGVMIGVQLS